MAPKDYALIAITLNAARGIDDDNRAVDYCLGHLVRSFENQRDKNFDARIFLKTAGAEPVFVLGTGYVPMRSSARLGNPNASRDAAVAASLLSKL